MKKTMLTLTLIATAIASFSQTTLPTHSSDYYSTKSRHQRTAAWIMLGGGVVLIGLGLATTQAEVITGSDKSNTAANVLAGVGLASTLGSIPLFISAAHNKHKAAELSFDMQKVPVLTAAANRGVLFQPALAWKISL